MNEIKLGPSSELRDFFGGRGWDPPFTHFYNTQLIIR
jgi:hypothetical protein